ncbi:MAG: uridine monophosphate kinase [Kiritimatiellae bacterium]|nr:uridine monophosphate kinase [Kiritimatiellia bacterium]
MKRKIKFKRILLKLSGEVLANRETGECIDPKRLAFMAERVKKIHKLGCEVGIVLGGGNIFRGLSGSENGVNRVTGDSMGMLATIINGLAMMNALESIGVPTRVMTSIDMPKLAEPFIQRKAIRHFEKGRVCIFAGGTGNPYFSTDSAAALRASEIGACSTSSLIHPGGSGTSLYLPYSPNMHSMPTFLACTASSKSS